jgi:hypothetical protein
MDLPTELGALVLGNKSNLPFILEEHGWVWMDEARTKVSRESLVELEKDGWTWINSYNYLPEPESDAINPKHYTHFKGLEVIDLAEQLNYNRGNVVKYVARAGVKNVDTEMEDLEKAKWYIEREIERIRSGAEN